MDELEAQSESPTAKVTRWFKCVSGPILATIGVIEINQIAALTPEEASAWVTMGCLIEALEFEIPESEE